MDKFVIAITRTCGSGATSIGKILAKNLGVEIYDRNILRLASDDSGISEELFDAFNVDDYDEREEKRSRASGPSAGRRTFCSGRPRRYIQEA